MSDPTASLRDRTSVLGVALTQWADRGTARDKAAAKAARYKARERARVRTPRG